MLLAGDLANQAEYVYSVYSVRHRQSPVKLAASDPDFIENRLIDKVLSLPRSHVSSFAITWQFNVGGLFLALMS